MIQKTLILILAILTTLTYSCSENKENKKNNKTDLKAKNDSLKRSLKQNIQYFGESLLGGKRMIIQNYIDKYQTDSCGIITYADSVLKSRFEGIKNIGDINGDNKLDTIFVIQPFNYCDDGQSYCFFDSSLPRLHTDSYCCHPDNFFSISDIDEDGIQEVGIYYSTCVSRYKYLKIYSLKNRQWEQIATSVFDIQTQDPTKVSFKQLIKKTAKNEFKICNFEEGKTYWEAVKMK